jgi:uncharacterized membrane protein
MLKFYLISTFISVMVFIISVVALGYRLKREGYIATETYTFWESLHSSLPILAPILNIIIALGCIFNSDEAYEKVKSKRIKEKEIKDAGDKMHKL